MNVKRSVRVRNVALVFIGTVMMSFTCFVMIYYFNVLKQIEEKTKKENLEKGIDDPIINYRIQFISWLMGFLISKLNKILTRVVTVITAYEKHETKTALNLSIALKLTIAKFADSSVVPVMVNLTFNDWQANDGLV
jgi:hypothetical protein